MRRYFILSIVLYRLQSVNACYLSVQNIWSSSSLSKNINIKIYITIILPVCLAVKTYLADTEGETSAEGV
jgi:hypothetical protein